MINREERPKVRRENVKTFKDLILESSKVFNSKTYLSYQKDNGEIVNVSFSETAKYCEFYSAWINTNFKSKISSREIHVGVLGHGNFNYLLIYFATIYSGHVTVPIDPNSDLETLKYCVNHGDIDIIFYDKNLQPKIDYLKSNCPNVKQFILINKYQEKNKEENNNRDNYSLDDILEEYKDKTFSTTVKPDDNAFIFFTSGTTGKKKGVVITNECIAEKVFSENCLEGDKDEVCLSVLPLYHVFSTSEFFYSLRLGFNVCFGQNLTKLIQYFHIFKPTIMTCVPLIAKNLVAQVLRILKEYPGISVDVARSKIFGPSFSTMIVGGSHFPESVIKEFYSISINRIGMGYGLTETFGNSTQPDFNPKKISSIGKLAPGFQVRFKDGEIQLKSKSVMKEYYKAPDQTKEILTDDNWIRTGDLGFVDEDGYIYLTGRKKNLIILSNGENVSPEAIEQKFFDEMLIQEIIVYGKNDILCAEVFPNYDYAKMANIPNDNIKDLIWKIIEEKNKTLPSYEKIVKLTIRESPFAKTSTRKIIRQKFMEELKERERKEEIQNENEKDFDLLKPSNDLQKRIYQCISKTLNDKEFGINANLYEYGLNSVSCTMLVHDLRHEFNIPIGLNEIINNSSVLKIEKFIRNNFSIILSKEDSSSENTSNSNESDDIRPPVSIGLNNKRKIGAYNCDIEKEPEIQLLRDSSNINAKNSRVTVQKSLYDTDKTTLDYAGEVSIIDDINISSKNLPEFKFPDKNATLFLTGATGFLGSHLLATYLDKYPEAKVYCLVRGKDKESAMKRLKKNCITYMTWKNEWEGNNNIVTICGDLSKRYFGLKKDEWKQLCEDVDIIIHSGAIVHWLYPYSQLKPTNVLSTKQCLKMASTHHLKPLYFVSSTSIFNCQSSISSMEESNEEITIQESDDLEKYSTGIMNGYGQSKWVSEKLISKAIERGVPACIIRPGFILGSEKNGMLNTDDFIIRMMIGCAQLKMAPDLSTVINTCPVDYVVGAMVQIASDEQWLKHHVYHMWNSPTISFNDIFDEMERYGYEMKRVSYEEWCSALKYMDPSKLEKNALFPLLYFVLNGLMIKMQSPPLNDDNTREAIADSDVPDNNIRGLIGKYLAYLNKINLLAPPSEPEYSIPLPNIGEIAITTTIGRNNQL